MIKAYFYAFIILYEKGSIMAEGTGAGNASALIKLITAEVNKAIKGKEELVEKVFMAILAKGHILLDDVPGVGKTTLATAISNVIGMNYERIQFTPDVLPSDIVGFSMYDKESGKFRYMPGVINTANLLLGDEINRTSSKTQAALLEAMEERQVTVDGKTYELPKPFIVIATQNNVGSVGTQLLPHAQLDRFLVKLSIGYPDLQTEMDIIRSNIEGNPAKSLKQIVGDKHILVLQDYVSKIEVKDCVLEYIASLTAASRSCEYVEVGISPRGAIALCAMARSRALVKGREYVMPEDVRMIFADVCAHRLVLNQQAKIKKVTAETVCRMIVDSVNPPDSIDRTKTDVEE